VLLIVLLIEDSPPGGKALEHEHDQEHEREEADATILSHTASGRARRAEVQ
jgi:hypothetical protein